MLVVVAARRKGVEVNALIAVTLIGLLAIALYGVFGGADFGGGVWDLLASGPRRDAQRAAITHAIGPVWEANHVWLIFTIVLVFTCFPPAFAEIATRLNTPLTFALIGIVLRGAAFVFRNYVDASGLKIAWSAVFGTASLIAPFFLGTVVGAIATGDYAWTSPFALAIGVFAVALTAQVAAVFLLRETNDPALRGDFRRRAIAATLAVWVAGVFPIALAYATEPPFFASLWAPIARFAIFIATLLGLGVMAAVARGADLPARVFVVAEIVTVLAGWFSAQAPWLVPGRLSYMQASAGNATIEAFLIAAAIGSIFLLPSLALLFSVFKGLT